MPFHYMMNSTWANNYPTSDTIVEQIANTDGVKSGMYNIFVVIRNFLDVKLELIVPYTYTQPG